jgi:hypothetical protein
MNRKKPLTIFLEWVAEDNRLPLVEAKRILRIIIIKIAQWKAQQ